MNETPKFKYAKFHCPESPYIAWHWGLIYAECPLSKGERDGKGSCAKCSLNDNAVKAVVNKPKRKKKSPVPKIGKTYNS